MRKKFQVVPSKDGLRVIVRMGDEDIKDRYYRNLTWSTVRRLDKLIFNAKYKVTTVSSPRSVHVFIQEA